MLMLLSPGQNFKKEGCGDLGMVVLAYNPVMPEAEIGRIVVQNQPRQNVIQTLISTNNLGMVACP
jgi:hypothetical protein